MKRKVEVESTSSNEGVRTRREQNEAIKKIKRKRRNKLIALFVVAIVLAVVAWATAVFFDAKDAVNKTNQEITIQKIRDKERNDQDPFSILLIGIDQGGEYGYTDNARADTIIVATVNPKTKETTLVSVPRDTLAPMKVKETEEGYGLVDKINHSYAYGGIEGVVNTVQNYLQVPIDEYIQIDIDGLMKLVDSLGGVDVVSPISFEQEGIVFEKDKTIHLNGLAANIFARMRYLDIEGVAGREHRQRLLITALAKKMLSFDTVFNYKAVLDTLSNNIKMSFTFDELLAIKDNYLDAFKTIKQDHFQVIGIDISGGYYDFIADSEHLRVSNLLLTNLNQSVITLDTLKDKKVVMSSYGLTTFRLFGPNEEYIDSEGNPTVNTSNVVETLDTGVFVPQTTTELETTSALPVETTNVTRRVVNTETATETTLQTIDQTTESTMADTSR